MMNIYITIIVSGMSLISLLVVQSVISDRVSSTSSRQTMFSEENCATDHPSQTENNFRVRSGCLLLCLEKADCSGVNWKNPSTCELFLRSYPANFVNTPYCNFHARDDICQNGGTSMEEGGEYICNCPQYLTGKQCEFRIDCSSYPKGPDGLRTVNVSGQLVTVYCDWTTSDEGWLVFQRRTDGSVDFYQNWTTYKQGFGDKLNEFWLGLDLIHQLTSARRYKLRIDLRDFNGSRRYAEYENFTIGSPATNYVLHVGAYTGDAGDCLGTKSTSPTFPSWAQGMQFSTYDADHDTCPFSCASNFKGAWWYSCCLCGNLNGLYLRGDHTSYFDGMDWELWTGSYYSLQFSEMKIALMP